MNGIKLGPNNWAPSPALVQWIAPSLTAGDAIPDRIGGFNLGKGPSQSADTVTGTYGVWGTTHRFRAYAHTNGDRAPTYSPAAAQSRYVDANTSLLMFVRGEFTLPGSATVFWRCGGGTVGPGWKFRLGASGVQQYYVTTNESAPTEVLALQTTLAAAGGVSESFACLFDGRNKVCKAAVNGVVNPANGTLPEGRIITAATTQLGFGDSGGAVGAAYQELQLYVITGELPANIDDLLTSLHFRPYVPLSATELAG